MAEALGDTYGLMHLPGVSDAGGPEVRRLLPRGGRQPAQGVRQEDPRAHGQASGRSSSPAASATGYGRELGTKLFDIIEPFADYAFNKSHSYGYGLVAYQTAWLKAHYPVEYLAALLTTVKDDKDKTAVVPRRVPGHGHRRSWSPTSTGRWPSSRRGSPAGSARRRPTGAGRCPGLIPFGLSAIRNVGEGLVEPVVAERETGGPVRRLLRLLPAGRPHGAQQADDRVADQGGGVRLPRPPPPGAVPGVRGDRRPHPRAPPGARRGRDELVRRPWTAGRRRRSTTPGSRSPTPSSTRTSGWPSRRRCSGSTSATTR